MAVVGDNRGGSNSRVAQRPDGAWSFEDARRRREQRQAGPTASAHLRSGEADEDLSALALGLADSLTFDGTPLSQLDIHQDLDASTPERPADDAPTAEEIMRALEAEQRAAKAASDTGSLRTAHGPRSARSPHRPSTRRPHHRRLLPPRRWAIACSLLAAGLGVLAVQLASGTGPNPGGHPTRALASGATAPTSGLIEAAMNSFLGAEHAVDHRLNPPRARTARTSRPRRPHHQLARVPNSTSPARSPSQSTSTAIDDRRIGLDRHDRANQPNELDPALELDALRIKSTTPDEPVANRTPLELDAPPPNPKRPSVRWSLEPAAAAANSPHASNVDRKVGDT